MKINDKIRHDHNTKSNALHGNNRDGPTDLAKAIRSMNPSFFNPQTHEQNTRSFIPDLLYHDELDRVDSLHNAVTHPNSFVPPPISTDPKYSMTSQAINNLNYYPVGNNFFNRDQFKCYATTMTLIDQMNKEKPAHLKQYDRRYLEEGNVLSTGNQLYKKNENLDPNSPVSEKHKSPSMVQLSPEREPSPAKKYGIVIDKASSNPVSPQPSSIVKNKQARQNILSKKGVKAVTYEGKF